MNKYVEAERMLKRAIGLLFAEIEGVEKSKLAAWRS